jgi:hypothetical protein
MESKQTTRQPDDGGAVAPQTPVDLEVLGGTGGWLLGRLKEEPGLSLTFGYIILTAIGVTYEYHLFRAFGLNILDYAEISDFLVAALKEPFVILLSVASLAVLALAVGLNLWFQKRSHRYAAWNRRLTTSRPARLADALLMATIVAGYFYMFASLYADVAARRIKAGRGAVVTVEQTADARPADGVPGPKPALVGTTSRFLFLYDHGTRKTVVLPIDSIARIIVSPR